MAAGTLVPAVSEAQAQALSVQPCLRFNEQLKSSSYLKFELGFLHVTKIIIS